MSDLIIALQWWLALWLIGMAVWPISAKIFPNWVNQGYLQAKPLGILLVSFLVWIFGNVGVFNFTFKSVAIVLVLIGIFNWKWLKQSFHPDWKKVVGDEVLFVLALFIWTYIKGHAPEINGLEKFMDYGFAQSILKNGVFPPPDIWFSGEPINYYYFGHLMMAVITILARINLAFGFNLMLSTLFAFTFSLSFAIGRHLFANIGGKRAILGGLLIGFLVSLTGNLQTIYAFTQGYQGDYPPPFWEIFVNPLNVDEVRVGFQSYWYPNATRFIPFTIHEFPGYSFVVSDIHGHVLSLPIVLLMLMVLINIWKKESGKEGVFSFILYGWLAGMAMMTNALDGLIYMGLLLIFMVFKILPQKSKALKQLVISVSLATGAMVITIAPFLANFDSFVSGVAINCPPQFLANNTFGPIIFEGVEKCQKSPLWMMLVLWGFFVYFAVVMIKIVPKGEAYKNFAICLSLFCLGLIIFPEFFYFKDIYPTHFRSNTMFKLGYQAFIIMSIVSGWTLYQLVLNPKKYRWYLLGSLPLVFLVMIYPYFSVKSYFGNLREYKGLYGLEWMKNEYQENWMVVNWFNSLPNKYMPTHILEAQGDSYHDSITHKPYNQISAFTGNPTVAGWYVHEWLWRGQDKIAFRAGEVRKIYEAESAGSAWQLLKKYQVKYVVVGEMEREKYHNLNENNFLMIGKKVYTAGETNVYEIL